MNISPLSSMTHNPLGFQIVLIDHHPNGFHPMVNVKDVVGILGRKALCAISPRSSSENPRNSSRAKENRLNVSGRKGFHFKSAARGSKRADHDPDDFLSDLGPCLFCQSFLGANASINHKPIDVVIRPWGSTATIVAQLFFANNQQIPQTIAKLLVCGILSDTTNLESSSTTTWDAKVHTFTIWKQSTLKIEKFFFSTISHFNSLFVPRMTVS